MLKPAAKFILLLAVMTLGCTLAWACLAGELYDCTDAGFLDFLSPGNWVHDRPGHPVTTVEKIVHGRAMSEPDTIRQGWTVAKLWCLWFSFAGVSLIVSIALSRKTWISSSNLPPTHPFRTS